MLFDLIIIGGGPAGCAAGIYAARKRLKTLLITKDFLGQIAKTGEVENYPGLTGLNGMDLAAKLEKHLKKFVRETGSVLRILEGQEAAGIGKKGKSFWVRTDKKERFESRAMILATGRDPRPLEAPGEKDFIGRGVSYCSICDAPLFKDKSVVVVGGGNSGFEAALDLVPYARRIFILERDGEFRADEVLREKARKEPKIKLYASTEIVSIEGKETVEGVRCRDRTTKKVRRIAAQGVFVAIGSVPATGFLKGLAKFNKRDEIKVDPLTMASSCPGLYAAGDINDTPWKQIVIAAGQGATAALEAHKYLRKNNS